MHYKLISSKNIEGEIVSRELKNRRVKFLPRQALHHAFRQQALFEARMRGLRRLTDDELENGIQFNDFAI